MKDYYSTEPDSSNGVIWTNGCYDILHIGHIRLLKKCQTLAEEQGYNFFVGIDSNDRVKEMKGSSRPINTEEDRAEILLSIKGVQRVYIYDTTEELTTIIKGLTPIAIVVGEEYKSKKVIGAEYAKDVIYFNKIHGQSTTNILKQRNKYGI